jgi:hypothetical protein
MYYKHHQELVNHPNQALKKKHIMKDMELMKIPRTLFIKLLFPTTSFHKKTETLNKTSNSGKEKLVMLNKKKPPNSNKRMKNTEPLLQLLNQLTITKTNSMLPKSIDLKVMLKTNKTKSED